MVKAAMFEKIPSNVVLSIPSKKAENMQNYDIYAKHLFRTTNQLQKVPLKMPAWLACWKKEVMAYRLRQSFISQMQFDIRISNPLGKGSYTSPGGSYTPVREPLNWRVVLKCL